MALTPVEIRHMTPGRSLFGYNAGATDRLLEEIAASFEDVWRERADLADKVEQLEADLVRYRELEALLRTTLVSAERASAELKEQARREAELILTEAHAEARAVQRQALAENERLVGESRRVREQLKAALAAVDQAETEDDSAAGAAGRRRAGSAIRSGQDLAGSRGGVARGYTELHGRRVHHTVATAGHARRAHRRDRRPPRRRLEGARHRRRRARARERRGAPAARRHARVPLDDLTLVWGHTSREKTVELTGHRPRRSPSGVSPRRWRRTGAMSVDPEHFRAVLLEERERVERRDREPPGRPSRQPRRRGRGGLGHERQAISAETATATLDREIDYTLEENSTQVLGEIDAALRGSRPAPTGRARAAASEIAAERLEAYPWASLCIDCKRKPERG